MSRIRARKSLEREQDSAQESLSPRPKPQVQRSVPAPPSQPPKITSFATNYRRAQRLSYAGWTSTDSWVTWGGSWKSGAEEKWKHLRDLYGKAANIINKNPDAYPKRTIKALKKLNENEIGFSKYDEALAVLNDAHLEIDRVKLTERDTYQIQFAQDLLPFYQDDCRILQSNQVRILGGNPFERHAKALLCKIYASTYGKKISDEILDVIENQNTRRRLTFQEGPECLHNYGDTESTIDIDLGLNDYATGKDGEIIPSTVEIAIVHEMGHMQGYIDSDTRGTPKKEYQSLDGDDKYLWSDDEEYTNINQIENKHRRSLNIPNRQYHSGDPLIHMVQDYLTFIARNHDEFNVAILKHAADGDTSFLLSAGELADFQEAQTLYNIAGRNNAQAMRLRFLARKHMPKIKALRKITLPRGVTQYDEWEAEGDTALNHHGSWRNKVVPGTTW